MLNVNALKGAVYASGHTMIEAAEAIGVSRQTLTRKLTNQTLTITEVDKLIRWAHITHPEEVFPYGK